VKRALTTWVGGALGLAALWRFLRQEREAARAAPAPPPEADPAAELRARLDEARDAAEDRDDFDAAEGQPLDEVEGAAEPARSVEDRRRAIHEKAQQALGEMQQPGKDE
jgi:hypothetical protein